MGNYGHRTRIYIRIFQQKVISISKCGEVDKVRTGTARMRSSGGGQDEMDLASVNLINYGLTKISNFQEELNVVRAQVLNYLTNQLLWELR